MAHSLKPALRHWARMRGRAAGGAPAPEPSTLLNGLTAYYALNGNGDDAEGNPVTLTGSASFVDGRVGQATALTGTQYWSANSHANLQAGNGSFTVAAWLWPTATGNDRVLVAKWNQPAAKREYMLRLNSPSRIAEFQVSATGATGVSVTASDTGALLAGTWWFVVAWYDADAGKIRIQVNDGVVQEADFSAGILNSDSVFAIGARNIESTPSAFLQANIDGVGLWQRVLTAEERTELYNGTLGIEYPFSDSGSVIGANIIRASNTTLARTASRVPHQRSCCRAHGRYWLFYGNYNAAAGPFDLYYTSSADGRTWAAGVLLTTFPFADAQWGIHYVPGSGKLHIAKNIQETVDSAHDGLLYRRGTPNADGTITWDADWQTAVATGTTVGDWSMVVDTDGRVWVGYCEGGSRPNDGSDNAAVTKNANLDGTWSTASGFPVALTSSGDIRFALLSPLTEGGMHASAYKWNADIPATGYYSGDGSATFTSEGNITLSNVEANSGDSAKVGRIESASMSDGEVHLVYQDSTQNIKYRKRASNGTWGSETTLSDNTRVDDAISSPRLSFDDDGRIYVTWTGKNKIWIVYFNGSTWGTPQAVVFEGFDPAYEHVMPAEHIQPAMVQMTSLASTFYLRHYVATIEV